jgi:hypothetical protein
MNSTSPAQPDCKVSPAGQRPTWRDSSFMGADGNVYALTSSETSATIVKVAP